MTIGYTGPHAQCSLLLVGLRR